MAEQYEIIVTVCPVDVKGDVIGTSGHGHLMVTGSDIAGWLATDERGRMVNDVAFGRRILVPAFATAWAHAEHK